MEIHFIFFPITMSLNANFLFSSLDKTSDHPKTYYRRDIGVFSLPNDGNSSLQST